MSSMRRLVLTAPGRTEWQEVPAPRLQGAGEALVRPLAAGRCDFDRLLVDGRMPLPLPVAIGHEMVAEVIEVGPAVSGVRAGDRVVVPYQVACGGCSKCRAGLTSSCLEQPWLSCFGLGAAAGGFDGALSDVVRIPYADAMLVPLPEGLAPEHAAAAGCNVVDAYRCVGPQLERSPQAPVLVMGGDFGTIALYAVAIAAALGSSRIDYVDADPDRRERAERLGARAHADAAEIPRATYPIVVDASRDPERLVAALRATAPDGVCTASTMYVDGLTPVPLGDLFETGGTLTTGQPHARALLEPALALLADGRVDPGLVTAAVLPWEDAAEAYPTAEGKVVFVRAG